MPPSYTDLGKQVKDLFSKGYSKSLWLQFQIHHPIIAHGFLKFDSTTRPANGDPVEFKAGAEHSLSTQKLLGKVEVKYSLPKYGMIFTEKVEWTDIDIQMPHYTLYCLVEHRQCSRISARDCGSIRERCESDPRHFLCSSYRETHRRSQG